MSDSKPDQILAEENNDPWVKLILWTQESSCPSYRWNGFMKYLGVERLKLLEPLNLTEEQRLGVMKRLGADSVEYRRARPLLDDDLADAKKLFPIDTDFGDMGPAITIDNHRFSEAFDFKGAFFLSTIRFENCCFERGVGFYNANFEWGLIFGF
mgnify:FL=1